ncbi:hypothetical protein BUAKA3JSW_03445 [Bacteroides uniformis]|nr:hypothetical protein BUAKA3JSW_03445 [Bacteroides uniformis]
MIQVNRIYLIFNRLVTKKFLVDTSEVKYQEAENSCLERVSPGNCFFMHFRTVAGHMVLRSLYNSSCTTIPIARSQRSPGCTFAVF